MNIIMLGAQGTGKGTVAGLISEQTGLPQISTGDIFRKNISEKTPLGVEADKYISKGNLVPDELTIKMIKERLAEKDVENGVILDGFPRTEAQAIALDKMLEEEGKKVDLVIDLSSPKEEILDRIVTRRICPKCKAVYNTKLNKPKKEGICDTCGEKLVLRDDDKPETVSKRLTVYHEQTQPLIDYYTKQDVLKTVDGTRTLDEVFQEIVEILGE